MKVNVFKRTSDEWHPSYRLSVWDGGMDMFHMRYWVRGCDHAGSSGYGVC